MSNSILLRENQGGNIIMVEVGGVEVGEIEITDGHYDYTDFNNPLETKEIKHIGELFEMFDPSNTKRSAKGLYEEIRFSDDIKQAQMESAGSYVTYYESLDQLVDERVEQGWEREEVLFDLEYVDQFDLEDMEQDFILIDREGVEGGKVFNENHSLNEVIEYMKEDQDMSPFVKGTSANVRRERNHSFFKGRE